MFGISNQEKPLPRNSEDRKTFPRGDSLLNLCKSLDFLIVNGRKSGDIFGKFTSSQWNDSSVVDYVITSMASFDRISSMEVNNFYPWLSDHCALKYSLSLNKEIIDNNKDATASLQEIPRKFSWNAAASQVKFKSELQSESVKAKFESITENTSESSAEIVNKLTEILLSCAETSGLKQMHKRKGMFTIGLKFQVICTRK